MQTPSYQQVAPFHFSKKTLLLNFCFLGATGGIRTRDGVRTAFLFFDLSFQAKSHLAKECSLSPHISPMCRVPILSTGRSLSFFKKTISALYSVFLELLAGFEPATAFALLSCFSICLFKPNLTLRKSALFPRTYPPCAGSPFYQQVAPFHFSKKLFPLYILFFWSYWRDSNPRPVDYESTALAD